MEGKVLKKIEKIVLVFLVFVMLATTGLSCTPSTSSTQQPEITLTMWGLFDNAEVWAPIIKDFQLENPNIKVNYVKKDYSEYEDKTVDALASGNGPDIWLIRNDSVYKHYQKLVSMPNGLLAQVQKTQGKTDEEIYKQTYAPVAAEDNIIDGKIYGIPMYIDTLALIYNNSIFQDKRRALEDSKQVAPNDQLLLVPPLTWEDIITYTKLLTKKDGTNITQAGIALGESNNVSNSADILYALMLQNGTKMVSDDKKSAAFNLSQAKTTGEPVYPGTQALEFFTSFSNPSKETYSWNNSMPNSYDMFKQGKLAMMFGYAYQVNQLKQEVPTLNFNAAPLPQIKGASTPVDYASYWTETVTKNSKNPDSAWRFIAYASSKGLSNYISTTKLPSPLKAVDSIVPKTTERNINYANTFSFQVNSAKDWFKGRYPRKVDQAFLDMINNVAVYNQPTQTAIDSAATKVTQLLQAE
jgi:ABC-type glycerol-3-phosphate transport system substrate-binding protein